MSSFLTKYVHELAKRKRRNATREELLAYTRDYLFGMESTLLDLEERWGTRLVGGSDYMINTMETNVLGHVLRELDASFHKPTEYPFNLSLRELPWQDVDKKKGTSAQNALLRYLHPNIATEATVGDVYNLFNISSDGDIGLHIRSYGKRSYDITREVFGRVGVELPKISL